MNMLANLNLTEFFLHSAIPIGIIFIAERFFLVWLGSSPSKTAWVKQQFWLHPNFICRCRYFMGIASVLIFHFVSTKWGIIWFSFWMISDLTDGSIARNFGLQSEIGEVIDPLSDKLFYFPPLFYFAYQGWLDWTPIVIFFIIDFIGQTLRSATQVKAANLFGKTKTFLVVSAIAWIAAKEVYLQRQWAQLDEILLYIICCLAFCSAFFRSIPNYWYANTLSLLNFFCGVLGIVILFLGYPPIFALGLVFLGQFLDLFDGRCAELWGSTPNGDVLDDLADLTNFGGTIACLVYLSSPYLALGLGLAALHMIATTYRLWRFTKEKRQAKMEIGVAKFKGLPSPAAALLVGSTLVMLHDLQIETALSVLQGLVVLFSAGLMVSKLPYAHLGRTVLPKIPKMLLVFLYSLLLLLFLFSWHTNDYFLTIQFLFWAAVCYVIFGVSNLRLPKVQT